MLGANQDKQYYNITDLQHTNVTGGGQAWELEKPGGVVGILNASTVLNNGSVTSSCIFLGRTSYRVMSLRFCYSRGLCIL